MRRLLRGSAKRASAGGASLLARSLTALAGVVLVGVVLLLTAPAALAHAGLGQGSPGPGDEVGPGVSQVGLQFSGIDPDGDHTISLLDADDNALDIGTPVSIDETTICAQVDPMTTGVHAIEYSVVSDDGHFVQGRYEFEVTDDGAEATDLGCAAADLPAPESGESLGFEVAGLPVWLWAVLGGAALLAVLLAVVAIVRSRRIEE